MRREGPPLIGTSDSLSEGAEFWPTHTKEDRVDTSVAFSSNVQIQPALEISDSQELGKGGDAVFLLSFNAETTTRSTWLMVSQISVTSPSWTWHSLTDGYV